MLEILFGLLLPVCATTVGALAVFAPKSLFCGRKRRRAISCAYALFAGMMISSAFFGLLMPAMTLGSTGVFLPIGFAFGFLFLFVLNASLSLARGRTEANKKKNALGAASVLYIAAVLHNLPEGMAVGSALAGIRAGLPTEDGFSAILGIALQNLPDGAMISIPLCLAGVKRRRAFFLGVLSGVAEPIAALLAVAFFGAASWVLPILLAFSAAVMVDAAVEELLPKTDADRAATPLCFAVGFLLMMLTDVFL